MTAENPSSIPPSKAVRLADLVAYAPGSIVSRAIVQKPIGSLTIFALEAGQSINEHVTPCDAYVEVLDGEVELVIGGESVVAKTGETVLMPAQVPHAVYARQRFKMLLTMIRG